MNVYIVFGTTGEYSDRTEWVVKVFHNEERAKELVENASAVAREIFQKTESGELERWNLPDGLNKYDPKFQMDYTGTSYYIEEGWLEN